MPFLALGIAGDVFVVASIVLGAGESRHDGGAPILAAASEPGPEEQDGDNEDGSTRHGDREQEARPAEVTADGRVFKGMWVRTTRGVVFGYFDVGECWKSA